MNMKLGRFYRCRVNDGRAVLMWQRKEDELGVRQPRLWLCMVGTQLVACDSDWFIEGVDPQSTTHELRLLWKRHRAKVLRDRAMLRRVGSAAWLGRRQAGMVR